jgi:hypothetical protein
MYTVVPSRNFASEPNRSKTAFTGRNRAKLQCLPCLPVRPPSRSAVGSRSLCIALCLRSESASSNLLTALYCPRTRLWQMRGPVLGIRLMRQRLRVVNHRLIWLRLRILKRDPSRRLLLSAIPLFMTVWFMICFEVLDCPPSGPRNRFTAETTEGRFA